MEPWRADHHDRSQRTEQGRRCSCVRPTSPGAILSGLGREHGNAIDPTTRNRPQCSGHTAMLTVGVHSGPGECSTNPAPRTASARTRTRLPGHASGTRHCRNAFSPAHHRHQSGYHSLPELRFARERCRAPTHSPSQHSGLTKQWPDRTSTLHEALGASHRPLAPWRWATTHDLVDPAEAMSTSPDELQLERPFPVTGNLDRDMATGLSQHRLEPCSVANVRRSPIRRRLFLCHGRGAQSLLRSGQFRGRFW